ncbi:recombinase family protein [Bradyrhizobium sp. 2]|nr:recombinase family protein [Bradyrhizobium sp. 2]
MVEATEPKSKQAVAYVRVSSRAQEKRGDGLSSQEAVCRRYADAMGYEIVEVFREVLTGGAVDRPAMQSLMKYLRQHRAEGRYVIVDDISRFSRGHEAHWPLKKELARVGGVLCSPKMKFGNTANDRLVEGVMVTVSQHQRELNAEQTRTRMFGRVLNGYWPFASPMGYRHARVSGHAGLLLVRDEPVASIIQEAMEGFASGRFETQSEVKRFLESQPAFPRKIRKGEVHLQTVADILTKLLYAGYVEHKEWGVTPQKAKHEGLVSLETFERIQSRINGTARVPMRADIRSDFPLRGALSCASCGKPMSACWSTSKTGAKHPYYFCFGKGCDRYRKSVRRDEIETAFSEMLKQLVPAPKLVELARAMFKEAWRQRTAQAGELAESYKREIGKLEKETKRLIDLIVGTSSTEVAKAYERRVSEIEKQKLLLTEKRDQLGQKPGSFDELFELAVSFLSKPYELWVSGNLALQKLVLRLTFAEHLVYCPNEGLRTPKTTMPFKLLESFRGGKTKMARPKRFELLRGRMLSDSSIPLFTPRAAFFAAPLGRASSPQSSQLTLL